MDSGDDSNIDFGLPLELLGPGDVDAVLAKGLLRFCAVFDDIVGC